MKLLQVINSLGAGGAEKLVVDMCVAFSTRGLKVTVLLLDGNPYPLFEKLKEHSAINVINLGKGKSIYNPLLVFKIKHILKEFDIVHVHLFPSSYWVALARFISFNKPNIIFTEHNTTNRRREIPIFKYIDRWVYIQYQRIVTISDAVDTSLKHYLGKCFDNSIKIYNGIHLETFTDAQPYLKTELGFNTNDKLLIQVSSFTAQKDQKTLIKAISNLPPSYHLLLVGHGPLIEDAKLLVKQLKQEQRVQFLGIRNDVPRLLKSVDVVVLASHYEGLSLSCIEGMASGKPFIASNTPGLGDIVNGAGLVFEDNNDRELAEIIMDLTTDISFYEHTVRGCQKRAQQFDINIMISGYLTLYNDINKI